MTIRMQAIMAVALAAAAMAATAADKRPVAGVSAPGQIQAPANRRLTGQSANVRLLAQRVARLRHARDALRREAALPLPRNLSPADRSEAKRYNEWLKTAAKRLDALARRGQTLIRAQGKASSPAQQRHMGEMNQSFSMQYIQLQQKIQSESREYNLMSNIMKSRHEAAKNAINNIR
jgi:hypothetical protein